MSSVGTFSFPSFMANRTVRGNGAVSPAPLSPKCPISPPRPVPQSPQKHCRSFPQCTRPESIPQKSTFTPSQPIRGNAERVFYPQIGAGVRCKNGGGCFAANQLCCSDAKWMIAPQTGCAAMLQNRPFPPQNGLCCNDATWVVAPQIARAATMQKKKGGGGGITPQTGCVAMMHPNHSCCSNAKCAFASQIDHTMEMQNVWFCPKTAA